QIPRLNWVLRAFYGRYYQAPPLDTVTSPALNSDQSFLPLHGERAEQREFGLTIPLHAWTFDIANFRTGARTFFDHDVLGDSNANYCSGFLDGDGPAHLPSHTTFDLALGKSFGENWSLRLTALNFTNHRYMLDNSNTFGGTHFVNPREISLQLRYRFHY